MKQIEIPKKFWSESQLVACHTRRNGQGKCSIYNYNGNSYMCYDDSNGIELYILNETEELKDPKGMFWQLINDHCNDYCDGFDLYRRGLLSLIDYKLQNCGQYMIAKILKKDDCYKIDYILDCFGKPKILKK